MDCPFCEHPKPHKHGQTSKGSQCIHCANCQRTFTDTFDTLFYRRQVTPEQVDAIQQVHAEGSSLRGISRIGHRAYGTVVSIVRAASHKAQQAHNHEVQAVESGEIVADEMWSFVKKAKTLPAPRMGSWRLLDWSQSSQREWVNPQRQSGQAYR